MRLLPWPRVSVDQLRLGTGRPNSPSLAAAVVRAEVALAPLVLPPPLRRRLFVQFSVEASGELTLKGSTVNIN